MAVFKKISVKATLNFKSDALKTGLMSDDSLQDFVQCERNLYII